MTRRRNVIIVGGGKLRKHLADFLNQHPQLGYVVCGFVDDCQYSEARATTDDVRLLGNIDELSKIARAHFADEILIVPPINNSLLRSVLRRARRNRIDVKLVPEIYDSFVGPSLVDHIGTIPVLSLHREPIPADLFIIKRSIDVVISLLLLILTAPVMLLIALATKLDSAGPIFYCSRRVGRKGIEFVFYKFRTMVADADARKLLLQAANQRSGPVFKISNDPRITRVGKILRKLSLDELPQLWNVLKGNMSLVGPRPHPIDDFANYKLEHLRRLDVMPGITGLWQVTARRDRSFERNMALDLEYIDKWSPWQDFRILLKTIPALLKAEGE